MNSEHRRHAAPGMAGAPPGANRHTSPAANNPGLLDFRELFPDEEYQFKMRFHRGAIEGFFGRTHAQRSLLDQRRHWLETDARTHAAVLPEGVPLLEECLEFAQRLGAGLEGARGSTSNQDPWARCVELGQEWEPDFLLLKPNSEGRMSLFAGCVCFPSSWSLEEKLGHPVGDIHGVVPGLNAALGRQIDGFLERLKPGLSWERTNWGLSRSPQLNQHPRRNLPALDASVRLDEVWLRIEHQSLVALPRSGGVLFGIRLVIHPMAEVAGDPEVARRLHRALATMPEEMARYKRLDLARPALLRLLEHQSTKLARPFGLKNRRGS